MNFSRERIGGKTTMICGEHENDLVVSNTDTLQILVDSQGVESVSVVEVELWRRDEEVDVVAVGLPGVGMDSSECQG